MTRPITWLAVIALAIIAVAVAPHLVANPYQLGIVTIFFISAIVALGLNILVGLSGLYSLGHAGFYGIGAYVAALISLRYDLPLLFGIGLPILISTVLAAALAYPTVQVRGFYLTVITIAFGIIIQSGAIEWVSLTGGPMGLIGVKLPPIIWGFDRISSQAFYYVIGGIFVIALYLAGNIAVSSYGRAFRAVSQSEIAAKSLGIDPTSMRTISFSISASFAGVAGALYAYQNQYVSPESIGFFDSLRYLLMVVVGGAGTWLGPVVGAAILTLLPEVFQSLLGWQTFAYGALLAGTVYFAPLGVTGVAKSFLLRLRKNRNAPTTGAWPLTEIDLSDVLRPVTREIAPALTIRNVSVHFGGLKALDDVDDIIQPATVHGIIGPNGAGKSTLLNVISGFYKPTTGQVLLNDSALSLVTDFASAGIARTFQNTELFGNLTGLDNVLVGLHRGSHPNLFSAMLRLPGQERRDRDNTARAKRLLAYVGLSEFADTRASHLPFGHRRRLEIVRALAVGPRVLLLDEPAAGLTHHEIQNLAVLIRDLAVRGITVVLVEHHIDLIAAVCDRVTVLDYGRFVTSGSVSEIRSDRRVRDAYLGSTPIALRVEGVSAA